MIAIIKAIEYMNARISAQDEKINQLTAQLASGQDPVATVVKKGPSREWMSERLSGLPDGMYSLYTYPTLAQQPLSVAWTTAFAKRANDLDTADWTDNDMAAWVTREVEAGHGIGEKK